MKIRKSVWVLLSGAGVALPMVLAASPGGLGASAAAGSMGSCSFNTSPYAQSSATLQSCGYKEIKLASTTPTLDGGTAYEYVLPSGAISQVIVPPSSFNPLTASDRELTFFGLPARPVATDESALQTWQQEVSRVTFNVPPEALLLSPTNNLSTNSSNWSGLIATSSSPSTYTATVTQFTQPRNTVSLCNTNMQSLGSIWSGLGGESKTSPLAQDGTYFGSNNGGNGEFWYEFAPNPSMPLPNYAGVGDSVESSVAYDGGRVYTMTVWDHSNGAIFNQILTAPSGWTADGTIAEFIVERPVGFFNLTTNLPDFGDVYFQYSEIQTSGVWKYVQQVPYQEETMVSGNDVLAAVEQGPGIPGPQGSFPDAYVACS
jgi:Peptidase A4 family